MPEPDRPAASTTTPIAPLLSGAEVEAIFRRDARTIRRWVRAGHLRPVTVGRAVFFRRDDVQRLIAQRMTDAALDQLQARDPGRFSGSDPTTSIEEPIRPSVAHSDGCPSIAWRQFACDWCMVRSQMSA